ncbi:MAG: hypothetical protein HYW16_01215 [Candidatus Rokubacteria bacterium]|nr:hypothetical protein [Candidatus Rokubacteria bacterium]
MRTPWETIASRSANGWSGSTRSSRGSTRGAGNWPERSRAERVIDALYDHLQALHREALTILLVEQFVYGALEVADRGYVLERGTIVREGTGSDLLHDDYIQRTYLAL